MKTLEKIKELINKVRNITPLVHNITNYVTVNDCANAQLAIGGSPIMADDIDDVRDITKICNALVINIGTLNAGTVKSMQLSCEIANTNNIPIVLDPVGCGASKMRSETTIQLLEKYKFSAIRGNLSEISFIAGASSHSKGVDVSEEDEKNDAESIAVSVAKKYGCAVGITGKTDTITDGKSVFKINNGNVMMKSITGTGCMTSSLIGVFLGAGADGYTALCAGILTMCIAGDIAYDKTKYIGTGSLRVGIIDTISQMNENIISERAKIDEKTY